MNNGTNIEHADEKHYHFEIGFPPGFDIARYTRILPDKLEGTRHYRDRFREKRLPIAISKRWVLDATPITLTFRDRELLRYTVRGKWTDERDLSLVIVASTGFIVTGWYNSPRDWHRLTVAGAIYEVPA